MPINLSKFKGYQSGGISWSGIERLKTGTAQRSNVPKTDRREVMAKKAEKERTRATIPSYNQSSPFYNVPIIGGILKKDEEKTRKVADEILSERERKILAEGLKYKHTTRNMGGGITQYFFDDPNVPEDVRRNFQSVMEKVDYAKKSGAEKLMNRIGRQSIKTSVGDAGTKEYAAQAGIDDAGKVGNVVGDIAGTILGYNMPSGATGSGTVMGGANRLGEYAVQRAGTKIPQLITKPVVGRVAQGLIEDIPMSAYSALAERQSLGEAAMTYARNAPMTIGGELGMYGLGKVGKALQKSKLSRAAKKAAGVADDVGNAAGVDDVQEAITKPRPQAETEQLAEELRNAEPIKSQVDDTISKPVGKEAQFTNTRSGNFVNGSDGKPLTVYHGTNAEFDSFDNSMIGKRHKDDNGIFFSNMEDEALAEANTAQMSKGGKAQVKKANISLEKPLIIEASELPNAQYSYGHPINAYDSSREYVKQALKDGDYDGVIVKGTDKYKGNDMYIVKDAKQVQTIPADAEQVQTPSASKAARNGVHDVEDVIPIDKRTYESVGDRKVKSYQYTYPELKSEIQEEANLILGELDRGVKGERTPLKDEAGYIIGWTGTKKMVSPTVGRIQDATNASYADIRKALNSIVEDAGAENNALAKRIELIIDDNLTDGVKRFDGPDQPPNELYISKKAEIEGTPKTGPDIADEDLDDPLEAFARNNLEKSQKKTVPKPLPQTVTQDFTPATPKQQKYVADVTAKLPDNADGLNKWIADLTEKAAKETDKQKLLKINLQLFAAKKKLESLSKVYSNTLKNTDVIPQEVKNILDEDDFRYDPLSEEAQTKSARAKIDADAEGELRRIQDLSRTEYNQDDINVGMELLHDLSNKADLTDADIADIRKTAKGVSQAGRTQGRGVQAFAKYTRTKEGVIASVQKVADKTEEAIRKTNPKLWKRVQKDAQDIVDKAKKAGKPIDPDQALSLAKKRHNVPDLTDADITAISKHMDAYKNAVPGSRDAKESWHKVMQIMSSKIPPTWVDKFRGLQRISYLLNPKTILIRNPMGNVIMNIAETIKDLPGTMVDKVTSAVRKSDRTTTLPSVSRLKSQLAGAKEGLGEAVKDIKAGVDTSPTVGMLEMPRRDVFSNDWVGGRALNKADKLVGQLLQLGDRPFYEAAYKERIGDLMKLSKSDAVTDEMIDAAHDYALERVFQNDSGMAQFFRAIKTPPKNAPAGVKAAWGFIANFIIPFSKTPANILNKLLEYSPVGLAKAVGHGGLAKAGKTVFNQKYFVDNIARGLTGTGLALLGYAMANKGLIKGRADKDKDVAALERLMGINSYSFTIDGKSYTFDWAQPVGSVLAAGADAYYSGMDKDSFSEQMTAALQGYGNTFFNQSMMQNLTRFLNTYNPIAGVVGSVTNTANIVTPTLGAQVARTIDPYVRDTSADTAIGEIGNKLLSRTPGLSMLLPEKIDTLGQPQMQSQGRGILARAVEQFVSPGYFGDVDRANETMKKIYDVYKETDEKGVFPKIAPDSFSKTTKGEKQTIKLNAEQKREWQKISGEYYSKKFAARTAGKTAEGRAKALVKLADEAYEYAKKQVFK